MVMKRKAPRGAARRPAAKRRRIALRRRIPRPIVGAVNVKRTRYDGTWTFGTAATTDFWKYVDVNVGSLNNFTELAACFDEYRINAIKVTYRPAYDSVVNPSGPTVVLSQPQAYAHVIIDPASTVVPTGTYTSNVLNGFLESQGVRTYTLNKPFSVYFKPKVFDAVFNTGSAAAMRKSPWVRTSETAVSYRGYHIFLQQNNFATGNVNIKLDIFVTVYAQFRNLR